jgi:hypothetical protein
MPNHLTRTTQYLLCTVLGMLCTLSLLVPSGAQAQAVTAAYGPLTYVHSDGLGLSWQ